MPTTRSPRKGSLAYWPRKRAKKQTPVVRTFPVLKEPKLTGFAGYKAGMVTVMFRDTKKTSPTYNLEVSRSATLVECPPLKIASVRFYRKNAYGWRVVTEVLNTKLDKELARKISLPKEQKAVDLEKAAEKYDEVRMLVYTQPKLTTLETKRPHVFEMVVGGTKEEQLKFAKDYLDKELNIKDFFKAGDFVDFHAVTKGKGVNGPVRRYGVRLKSHKSEKSVRNAVLAAEGVAKVEYFSHQAGQLGYHLRTDYDKMIMKVIEDVKGMKHMKHYGELNSPCLLIKGSIPGTQKRIVRFHHTLKPKKKYSTQLPDIKIVN